jgi:hypothetical protein
MRYLISYDLHRPGQNYDAVIKAMNDLGAVRVLLSQWAVRRANTSANALRDHLVRYVDANDRILVVSIDSGDWASWNAMVDLNTI